MQVTIEGNELVIRIPLTTPQPSASGKTLSAASSHGNVKTAAMVNGKPVTVGVNCYIAKDLPRSVNSEAPDSVSLSRGLVVSGSFLELFFRSRAQAVEKLISDWCKGA